MKIRFFRLIGTFASLLLLLTIKSFREPAQVSGISQAKTSATRALRSPSFASVTTHGDRDWVGQPYVTSNTQLSAIEMPSISDGKRDMALAQKAPGSNLADDLVQLKAHAKRKLGYSLFGQITDINNKPIPDVTLAINSLVYATTDATGRYTVTDLVASTYTIIPSKSFFSFSPSWRRVDVLADEGEQNFIVEPDLGFRPERDGYSFDNPGQATPDCQALQRSFSGLNIQCAGNQPQQQYLALFERYKFSFRSGVCTGMAAASLAYYVGLVQHTTPTSRLTFDESWPDIATFHGRQYSKAVLDQRILGLSAWNTTDADVISQRVDQVYRQLKLTLQPGNPNPVVLDLVSRPGCETSGHTVTPYRLDETDPLHPKVYIYENYAAGDSSRFIQFDFSSQQHGFSYWKWNSGACGALVAIPIAAFTGSEDQIPSTHLGLAP